MGETANFTCRASGTNISISWEIDGIGNYRDCSNQTFCVNTFPDDSSANSTLRIDTAQVQDRRTVRCVVNQVFGGQNNSSNSTGQLTVRPPPTPTTTSKTYTQMLIVYKYMQTVF